MTRTAGLTGQGSLNLDFADCATKPVARDLEAVRFRCPNPRELWFGDKRMGEYLRLCGHEWVVRCFDVLEQVDCQPLLDGYPPSGQPPFHPRLMLGLIVYGIIKGVTSLREMEALARLDVGAMYLCGGLQPDHSTLGKFIRRHAQALTEDFFVRVTATLVRQLRVKAGPVALDGTLVEAAASRVRLIKTDAAIQTADEATQAAAAAPADEAAQQRAADAAHVARHAVERQAAREANHTKGKACLATTEPEAVVQPLKSGIIRPAYKPLVMANCDRMIVGQVLQQGNENAGVRPLLEQHEQVFGQQPTLALADAGFHTTGTLAMAVERNLNLLVPSGKERSPAMAKTTDGNIGKEQFTYDEMSDTYRCPQGKLLVLEQVIEGADSYRRYRCHDCDGCPLRDQCSSDKKGRSVRRFEGDALKEAMRALMKNPLARKHYAQRKAMVEPVFSVLKGRQRLQRFHRFGLVMAAAEFALHCIAYNLKLALRHVDQLVDGDARQGPLSILACVQWLVDRITRSTRAAGTRRSTSHHPRLCTTTTARVVPATIAAA